MRSPTAWSEAPAPPQRSVTTPVVIGGQDEARAGVLSKYFPGLQRPAVEAPAKLASRPRPTWFGLRPRPNQVYMTDARAGLDTPTPPNGPEPTALPVALQIPTDRAVTPTRAESPRPSPRVTRGETIGAGERDPMANPASNPSEVPDFGGKPSLPGEDGVNPLPPAAEPKPAEPVVEPMPHVPSVDPQDAPKPTPNPNPTPTPSTTPPPPTAVVPDADPRPTSTAEPAKPAKPAPGDEKAVKAVPPAAEPGPPSAMAGTNVPTSYSSASHHHHGLLSGHRKGHAASMVLASPQVAPTPQVKSSPQARPTILVKPSPQVKPTPQARPSPQIVLGATLDKMTWKRPCLRRLVRKVWQLGEYADPPTAAPH